MFEMAFDTPRRRGTMLVSILFHGLLGTALVVGPLWLVADPSEPPDRMPAFQLDKVQLLDSPVRNLPKGNPLGGSPHPGGAPRTPRTLQPSAISPVLPAAPAIPPGPEVSEESFGPPGDFVGADAAGPGVEPGPFGVPDGQGAAPIYEANAPDVIPPLALVTPEPVYPRPALTAKIEGIVILESIIGPDGVVRSARVLRSAHPLLDRAAEESVLKWRYRPARIGERAVAVYLTVTVRFAIHA